LVSRVLSCKMIRKALIFCGLLMLSFYSSIAQEVWTIGPMLHYNFGGEKRTTSFSIEAAYWNVYKFPYGLDFAVEFGRKKIRLYSEIQTGVGVTGISLGPVVEFDTAGSGTHLGVQCTAWVNYFIGADYRIRYIDKQTFHAGGVYGKLPIAHSGFDEDNNSSSGSWDWDD
jgi:hypothetical protein